MSLETELSIAGITAPGFVAAFVEGLKQMGLPSKFAFPASILSGMLFGILVYFVVPDTANIGFYIVIGLLEGLAASGVYSGGKKSWETIQDYRFKE